MSTPAMAAPRSASLWDTRQTEAQSQSGVRTTEDDRRRGPAGNASRYARACADQAERSRVFALDTGTAETFSKSTGAPA